MCIERGRATTHGRYDARPTADGTGEPVEQHCPPGCLHGHQTIRRQLHARLEGRPGVTVLGPVERMFNEQGALEAL